jgi:hypothetical protein
VTDPEPRSNAERLDEEELRLDPLEAGMDPPERWSEADRYGMTEAEQRRGASLAERLAEEEPEVSAERRDSRATSGHEDGMPLVEVLPEAVRRGQSADQAGGSVAEEIRTPREPG